MYNPSRLQNYKIYRTKYFLHGIERMAKNDTATIKL